MGDNRIDEEIRDMEKLHYKNWQRISFNLRKHLDNWSHENVKACWEDMKLSYWPIICNIGIDGSTASELANRSMINKQNMSRTVKELEGHGLITSKMNKNDKRSEVLYLTDAGKKLVFSINKEVQSINDIYKEIVGEKDLEIAIDVLNKILAYHEQLASSKSTEL